MVDINVIGPATLAVSQGVNAFQSFLPKLSEVRRASVTEDPDIAADVRLGEVAAVTLTVGIGVIVSSLTGSPVPAFTAAVISLILVCLYESTLRADRPMEPKTNNRLKVAVSDA